PSLPDTSGALASGEIWATLVPFGRLFVGPRDGQQARFAPSRPHELHPHRQPLRVNPQGIEIAGMPLILLGRVRRSSSARVAVSWPPVTRTCVSPTRGGEIGAVGARITSTSSNAASKSVMTSRRA